MTQTEQQPAPPPETPPEPQRRGLRPLEVAGLVAALAVAGVILALVIHGPASPALPGNAASTQGSQFAGLEVTPPQPVPPLALRNYAGDEVNIAGDRGYAVFVTFLYTHCPDVCPLIAANLHNTMTELGSKSSDVRVIAVSVDPHGDTPSTVAAFTKAHGWTAAMKYLIGSSAELAPVWKAWNVGSEADVGNPGLINHSALVYGISASGKLMTIYDARFSPSQIIHDVPRLLQS